MAIVDLSLHPFTYVTIAELAEYWRLQRRHVLEHINAGDVEAIKLGPGIYRVRTSAALAFEARCVVPTSNCSRPLVTWLRASLNSTPVSDGPLEELACEDCGEMSRLPPGNGDAPDEAQ
jgi:hypothetical protein